MTINVFNEIDRIFTAASSMRHEGYGAPDHCDDCNRPMYGFTRKGSLVCKPCQIVRDGDLVCECCEGSGDEYGEVGEPCYQCNATGRLKAEELSKS